MEQKRIEWPDFAKGIGILLVVLGHAIIYTNSAGGVRDNLELRIWNHINAWIYSFHIPLFIFVSGVLQGYSEQKKKDVKTKGIIRKIIAYGIPYIVFSIVYWVFKLVFSSSVNNSVTLRELLLIFIYPLSDMWFLYALLVMWIIRQGALTLRINNTVFSVISIIITIVGYSVPLNAPFSDTILPRLLKLWGFYAVGITASGHLKEWAKATRKRKSWLTPVLVPFCVCGVNNRSHYCE